MRYGFINNFSQFLAADLAAGATTMTLDGGGALLSNASADLVYTLTMDDGAGTTEIVHVTAATGNDLTIERGKEGTSDATWPSGSQVEMRVTAGAMNSLTAMDSSPVLVGPVLELAGLSAFFDAGDTRGTVFIGDNLDLRAGLAAPNLKAPINIGYYNRLYDDGGYGQVVIGNDIYLKPGAIGAVVIGSGAGWGGGTEATGMVGAVCVGEYASCAYDHGIAIGASSAARLGGVAMGYQSGMSGDYSVVLGAEQWCGGTESVMIGHGGYVAGDYAVAVGFEVDVSDWGIGLGAAARVDVEGGMVTHAVPYLHKLTAQAPAAFTGANAVFRTSQQLVMRTDPIDLAAANEFELALPAGLRLFIDAIEVVAAATTSGTPEMAIGTTSGGVDAAAAQALTTGAAWSRSTLTPATTDGLAGSLFAHVTTTGTGSVYVILKGYAIHA